MLKSVSSNIARRMTSTVSNRLEFEKSQYLLQHKNNPVDWYPWGKEAFDVAKSRNVPIFLSVGYSTCHWCHVMEKESFENEETAKILNENFVSIKVDREERPDVDKMYMTFIVAVSGSGGWPMSVFLTPNLEPITGGTYFPPIDKYGMLGFTSILKMISEEWKKDHDGIIKSGKHILKLLGTDKEIGDVKHSDDIIQELFNFKLSKFDSKYGGFGGAPKFPKASDLDFLISCSKFDDQSERSNKCKEMLETTLNAMHYGGIHDHIGKGFHRYSVDTEWHVPHFEKMLYDQSQLLASYADFHRLMNKKDKESKKAIQDIFEYMTRCLSHEEGGFYAAEDADSFQKTDDNHKREGAFYVWSRNEVENLLKGKMIGSASMTDIVCEYFDIEDSGNVPRSSDPHEELKNLNVLRRLMEDSETACNFGITEDELKSGIEEAKKILFEEREKRPKPLLDIKMVTAWQGLSITGLVKAYQAMDDVEYLNRAEKCASFVKKYLVNEENGDLKRAAYKGPDGDIQYSSNQLAAFSDDYAFLIQGLLDIYTVNGCQETLKWAIELQTKMDEKFWNHNANNGYYISEDDENLGVNVRMIEDQDGAEPCATSIASNNLLRFYDITEDEKYREKANQCFQGSSQQLNKYAMSIPKMVIAHRRWQVGSTKVVIVGKKDDEIVKNVRKELNNSFVPNLTVVHIFSEDDISAHGPSHSEMAKAASPAIYICRNFVCDRPVRSFEEFKELFAKF